MHRSWQDIGAETVVNEQKSGLTRLNHMAEQEPPVQNPVEIDAITNQGAPRDAAPPQDIPDVGIRLFYLRLLFTGALL